MEGVPEGLPIVRRREVEGLLGLHKNAPLQEGEIELPSTLVIGRQRILVVPDRCSGEQDGKDGTASEDLRGYVRLADLFSNFHHRAAARGEEFHHRSIVWQFIQCRSEERRVGKD